MTPATRAPAAPTRKRILEVAENLILSRGYPSTTIDEICDTAGVSKGSFYHYFDSKEHLGLAVLEAYYARGIARLMDGPFREEREPVRRCLALLDHAEAIAEEVWADGCVLGSFAVDLADSSPRIHRAVSTRLSTLAQELAPVFREALERAPRRAAAPSAEALAEQFLAVVEGAIVLSKAHGDAGRIPAGIRTFRRLLELWLGR